MPVNTLLQPADYRYLLNDSRARVAVVSHALLPQLEAIPREDLPYLEHLVMAGEESGDVLSLPELMARVSALLRRASLGSNKEQESDTYADAYLAVDWAQARVTVGDRQVQLTPLEFRLLSTFVRHPRQVLSREQLLELVWGDAYGVGGDQVKLYIGYLRRKLDPDDPDGAPIETVRGFGYRYQAPS